MKTKSYSLKFSLQLVFVAPILFFACSPEEPVREDVPELITRITLRFTPTDGGDVIEASASDPDGEGVADIEADGPAVLVAGKTYNLDIILFNELVNPGQSGYDISAEVEEEGDEHMLFFAWDDALFTEPTGNGNADNRNDPVLYLDTDQNNLPLGLTTSWTTASTATSGKLRIVLKHQPGSKTANSGLSTGETDLDVTFDVTIQ